MPALEFSTRRPLTSTHTTVFGHTVPVVMTQARQVTQEKFPQHRSKSHSCLAVPPPSPPVPPRPHCRRPADT